VKIYLCPKNQILGFLRPSRYLLTRDVGIDSRRPIKRSPTVGWHPALLESSDSRQDILQGKNDKLEVSPVVQTKRHGSTSYFRRSLKHHPLFRYRCNSCGAGLPQPAATRLLAFKFLSRRLLVFDVTFPDGKAAGLLIVYPHHHRVDLECSKGGRQAVSHAA
jgi:hypothetical protein